MANSVDILTRLFRLKRYISRYLSCLKHKRKYHYLVSFFISDCEYTETDYWANHTPHHIALHAWNEFLWTTRHTSVAWRKYLPNISFSWNKLKLSFGNVITSKSPHIYKALSNTNFATKRVITNGAIYIYVIWRNGYKLPYVDVYIQQTVAFGLIGGTLLYQAMIITPYIIPQSLKTESYHYAIFSYLSII